MREGQAGEAVGRIMGIEKNLADQCKREPTWSECPLEVKVERLRDALLEMEGAMNFAGRTAVEARNLVAAHEHHPTRGIMKPAFDVFGNEPHALGYGNHLLRRLR